MKAAPTRTILDILRATLFLIDHYAAMSRPFVSLSELRRAIRKTMAELEVAEVREVASPAAAIPISLQGNPNQQP
jgi:hypothetical protein